MRGHWRFARVTYVTSISVGPMELDTVSLVTLSDTVIVTESTVSQPSTSTGPVVTVTRPPRTPPKEKVKSLKHKPMAELSPGQQDRRRAKSRLAQSVKRQRRAAAKRNLDLSASSSVAEYDGASGSRSASPIADSEIPVTIAPQENFDPGTEQSLPRDSGRRRGRRSGRGRTVDRSDDRRPSAERSPLGGATQPRGRRSTSGRGTHNPRGGHSERGRGSDQSQGSRENHGSIQNRGSTENRGSGRRRGQRSSGSRGNSRPNAAQVYGRGDIKFTLTAHRAGAGEGVAGEIHRILAMVPENYEISGLRHTGADQAAVDAHDDSSVGVVTRALTERGFDVRSTPVWSRYSLIVPTSWSAWEERADVVAALLIRNRKHGLPERSLRYVSSTLERDITAGSTKLRLWLDASPEAVVHIESKQQLLDTGVGKVVKLTPHRGRHPSDRA